MGYSAVTITTSPTLILAGNVQRHSIIISNESPINTVYFGPDTSITTSNSPGIAPGGNFCEDSGATNTWKGDIYGVVGSGTASVRVWERTQSA